MTVTGAIIVGAFVGVSGYILLLIGNPLDIISQEAMSGILAAHIPCGLGANIDNHDILSWGLYAL